MGGNTSVLAQQCRNPVAFYSLLYKDATCHHLPVMIWNSFFFVRQYDLTYET